MRLIGEQVLEGGDRVGVGRLVLQHLVVAFDRLGLVAERGLEHLGARDRERRRLVLLAGGFVQPDEPRLHLRQLLHLARTLEQHRDLREVLELGGAQPKRFVERRGGFLRPLELVVHRRQLEVHLALLFALELARERAERLIGVDEAAARQRER